jgi:hypothetical protein
MHTTAIRARACVRACVRAQTRVHTEMYKNPGQQFTVKPNVCVSSARNLLYVTLLAARIVRWLRDFFIIWARLSLSLPRLIYQTNNASEYGSLGHTWEGNGSNDPRELWIVYSKTHTYRFPFRIRNCTVCWLCASSDDDWVQSFFALPPQTMPERIICI